jgi:hypothetical protein
LSRLEGFWVDVKIGENGYAAITDREGMIIAHSDPSLAVKPPNVKHLPTVSHKLAGKKEASLL